MLILYKNDRNVRFELFTKTSKNLHTNQQNEHTPGFIIVAVLFFDKCNRIFNKVLMTISTFKTRKHFSKLRTGRSLTVCRSLLPGGVSTMGGRVCSWGVYPLGVCLLPGVCLLQGGVCSEVGCLLQGVCSWGVSAPGGWYPSMHSGRHPPVWTESQMPIKTLPWPNFVVAGNNSVKFNSHRASRYARFIRTVCTRRIRWSCEGLTSIPQQIHWIQLKHLLLRLCTTCRHQIYVLLY